MTEKRFYKTTSEIEDYRVYDDEEEDAYFVSCDEHTVDCLVELLNVLNDEKELYKMLWEQMSYYFREEVTLKDLDHKDFRTLKRLAKGLVD